MKPEILLKINKFFDTDIQSNPELIFSVLINIIDFDCAHIYLSEQLVYSYNPKVKCIHSISEDLKIKNSPFGRIEIAKNTCFSREDIIFFKTCASIIASLIKDIELTKIINMQVKALQDGIMEKNSEYEDAKETNDFFANFSHELRTPLNCIISSSELLSEKIFGELNEKQEEYINDIRVSGLHLLGMINDILDMAKFEAKLMKLNKTEFELAILLDEVCNMIIPIAIKKEIKILKKYQEPIIMFADRAKIQQVVFNLITNSIKYTPNGGEVKLFASKKDDKIELKIQDNGIGIEKKFQKTIFNKFMQIGNQQNSNGLGLTIVKEIIKLHKGKITLKSTPGIGTEFTISI